MFDNCGGSKDGRMAMTAGHSCKTPPTSISAFWDPRIARDSVNPKEACSLQMVIMLKRRVAKAFAKPRVYTSKAAWWCMQSFSYIPKVWVGVVSVMAIVGMLPPVQIYSKCGFPSGPGLKLLLELPKSGSPTKRCWCPGLRKRALTFPNPNPQNATCVQPSAFGGFGTHAQWFVLEKIWL